MSLKTDMERETQTALSYISSLRTEISEKRDMYTAAGKVSFFQQIADRYKETVGNISENMEKMIGTAKDQYEKDGEKNILTKSSDAGYQMALYNAVSLLKSQSFTDVKVMRDIIGVFKEDEFALASVKCAMKENQALCMYVQELPAGSTDKLSALEELLKIVLRLGMSPVNGDLNSKEYAARQILSALKNFDDKLLYIG